MNASTSKHKLMTGELINARWNDFKLNEIGTEGNLIAANGLFVASSWQSAKSCIAVFDTANPHRVTANIPLIRINLDPIGDLKFSPYSTNLIASSGDDGVVRLWTIPKEGLETDIEQATQTYTGHTRKVLFSHFHPCSGEVCGSASTDNTLQAWNICTGKAYAKVELNDNPYCIDWNKNGSLLGTLTKEKVVNIADPRNQKIVITAKAHEGSKAQKMCFCEDTYFSTVGFNKTEREVKLFDMRKASNGTIDAAVQTIELDKQRGVMSMQYDEDMKMIIIPSRGETVMHFVDVSSNQLIKLTEYKQNVPPRSFSWIEKRFVDYNKNEMQRMYRYIDNTLEILSLKTSRKSGGMDSSLYPETFNGTSALTGDEWASGLDKERNRQMIDKIESTNEVMTIVKKKSVTIEEKESKDDKIDRLEKENCELRLEIEKLNELLSQK